MNALRSVDERFEATVNKLQLNKKKPEQISVIGVNGRPKGGNRIGNARPSDDGSETIEPDEPIQQELDLNWENMKEAIYGKIVEKVGDRKYLEDWSNDVSTIAQRYIDWINLKLKDEKSDLAIEFNNYVQSLKHNINNGIDQKQAIEMLAQHLITKPVFEALFSEYSFVNNNPVSKAMESIVSQLEQYGFSKETEQLEPFYESVRVRAEGIDNAEAKQQIIITLYDKFFSKAFKSTTERLGIVFTPTEVVDFIVNSVDDVLNKHFGTSLSDKGVHILDPFTGTGTFIVRTLTYLKEQMQDGKITLADITHKFTQELHANEIVLLSYYIAAINIEATFDDVNGDDEGYVPFEGIVLTDTFESTEDQNTLDDSYFGTNDERLRRQQKTPITVIMGNPPYSSGQNSANDDNANIKYPVLEKRIEETYAKKTKSTLKTSLYDTYVEAFRWASDRIQDRGVISFVSNGSYIDGIAADGLRASLFEEFNYLYIFNLRGDQRTQGETSRKEGGKIFGSGSRTPIAISVLVKDGSQNHQVHYHDIGDYLSRDEKLKILYEKKSIQNIEWTEIIPDKNNDWINQRDEHCDKYPSMKKEIFNVNGIGVKTNRDTWVYSFGKKDVSKNVIKMINNYNNEVEKVSQSKKPNLNENYIKWSDGLFKYLNNEVIINFNESNIIVSEYRPFTKKYLYYGREIIERPGKFRTLFSNGGTSPLIYTTGKGTKKEFSALMTDVMPEYAMMDKGQGFSFADINEKNDLDLGSFTNVNAIYGLNEKETFYYIYGVLHSPMYKKKYASDLAKELPKIPKLKNIQKYISIGQELAELHLNYENQLPYPGVNVDINPNASYIVTKMKHPKKGQIDTIIYNSDIMISGIPEEAYNYVVNGRSAIEWIIDQYQVKTDKKSGITDNPNDFSDDPKYILNLLLSVITVSMKTNELVKQLPKFEVIEED